MRLRWCFCILSYCSSGIGSRTMLLYRVICFSFIVFNAKAIEEMACTEDQMPCDGGGCVAKGEWCNSVPDCGDGSDEKFCGPRNTHPACLPHHMECDDGTCIPLGAKCDNYNDCPDGSDEFKEICGNPQNPSRIIRKAEEWILSQRDPNYGWDANTERAVIALFLTNSQRYRGTKEGNLMKQQLSIQINSLILRNGTKEINLAKLACSVNSLIATCQDPRSFQGLDLVKQLRIRTNVKRSVNATIAPLVFLTLCLTNVSTPEDFRYMRNNFGGVQAKTDIEAVTLMAMACMAQEESNKLGYKSSEEEMVKDLAQKLAAKFKALNGRSTDVYTTALVIQALQATGYESWDKSSALRRLISLQYTNGSFGDILATYYALPALAGRSLVELRDITCPTEYHEPKAMEPSRKNQKEIKYSLWLGNPVTRTHTMSLRIDSNWTVIEVMRYAAEKNDFFSFHYEDSISGPSVYSIASIPNDAERELQWIAYRKPKSAITEQSREYYSSGNLLPMDFLYVPEGGENVILWYKSSK